ncbi:MAG: PD-(D/E)XK nuclease family protein [Opitutaceae bacterium]|nr:PD-(D/E)XK nuclease family protein [Verrucomicrobiales bacterium]
MQTRFLLGPAGSGKTHRCLAEIRAELRRSPGGPPLILLAPKQATFQLERQLLSDPELAGYTRLQILSFERLAEFILEQLGQSSGEFLSEEGRLMVLRALLARKRDELELFRASARLPGFVKQLHLVLRELQRHQLTPSRLRTLAAEIPSETQLDRKLRDIALLLDAYLDWLHRHKLQDADLLLDVATEALHRTRKPAGGPLGQIAGLWMDGFAEMTPQEIDLLAAFVPCCDTSLLAFCLDEEPPMESEVIRRNWLSNWSVVAQTFRACHSKVSAVSSGPVVVEILNRDPALSRFSQSPALAHLETNWASPEATAVATGGQVRLVVCPGPEGEAIEAAREILDFVRAGGRFRQTAVLLRQFQGYDDAIRRVFRRYEIPFFLDQRDPVAHHQLAELTRYALRTVAFQWRHDDWFGALKTGLVTDEESLLDMLENETLARGWAGEIWLRPLESNDEKKPLDHLERLRQAIVPAFSDLLETVQRHEFRLSGTQLTVAIRALWTRLGVEARLQQWSDEAGNDPRVAAVHQTVWQQIDDWLDNVARAFAEESLRLEEWLPILEAGLSGLSVGIIPPTLDQVLVGSIDRSRNPDLDLALVLGLNESVFPAQPGESGLLNEDDREALEGRGIVLGLSRRCQIGRERYYGYIAFTRARRRLVLSCSQRDARDRPLNPSPFFGHLQKLFPGLRVEQQVARVELPEARHWRDVIEPLSGLSDGSLAESFWRELASIPALGQWRTRLAEFSTMSSDEALSPELADQLYGKVLRTSVTSMERFAACPFQFFAANGLAAQERKMFELEARERGDFQHEVLARFHQELRAAGKKWRDLSPVAAAERIGRVADEVAMDFKGGMMNASAQSRFQTKALKQSLQRFVGVAVGWMSQYRFDPAEVELGFGSEHGPLPAWQIDLGNGRHLAFRGRIDRIDLFPLEDGRALAVVIDYKSGVKKFEPLLVANGLQLQLPSYLNVLRQLPESRGLLGVTDLIPAGVFYVSLRGSFESARNRDDVVGHRDEIGASAYRHVGRFDVDYLSAFGVASNGPGGQFTFKLKKDGRPFARGSDAVASGDFRSLLDGVEAQLQRMGRQIFEGVARLDPYERGAHRACDWCLFKAVCRIDPWEHVFRKLEMPASGEEPVE